ncbi:MAG: Asp-tRNA(Asn)/Glu-tRNA(Gln) amidotransferase subunit GatA [Patescibacteria group bacterium]
MISDLVVSIKSGQKTAVQTVQAALDKADECDDLNIFIELHAEQALVRAKEIDAQIAAGEDPGLLAGVPFAAKDNFLTNIGSTTAGANILGEFKSPITATSLQRLLDAGAVLIGKVNLDAFGHGASTESTHFGSTKNPHDATKVPGGSSGGSAAAVAAGIVPFSIGTDTGGSIRQPSALSGVYGMKPTYGLVSRYGVVAMASSTDCIGAIATNADDVGLVLSVMSAQDPRDGTTISADQDFTQEVSQPLQLGVVKQSMHGLDAQVDSAVTAAIKNLKTAGHEIVEVDLPSIELALPCYYILVPAEISSNLSRYDGIRYGYSDKDAKDLEQTYSSSRSTGFLDENKRRIMIGTYVLSSGYYDAYYKKAQRLRTKIIKEYNEAIDDLDGLVMPTSPVVAWSIGEKMDDPVKMYQADIMTVTANLVGVPSINIPLSTDGLPVGMQLLARQREDDKLVSMARALGEIL